MIVAPATSKIELNNTVLRTPTLNDYRAIFEVEPRSCQQILCVNLDQIEMFKWQPTTKSKDLLQITETSKVLNLLQKKSEMTKSSLVSSIRDKEDQQQFKVMQYMEDRWIAWNNYDIDILPFKKDPKLRDQLARGTFCFQTLKNHGGMRNDVQQLTRLPSNN